LTPTYSADSGSSGLTINLVGLTPLLGERIRASLRRSPFFFADSDEPLPGADLCLVPARRVAEARGPGRPPAIACGPPALLRSAFLAGCADYLKDPWTPEELELRALAVLARERARGAFPWGALVLGGTTLHTPAGPVGLTLHEARILRALLRARGSPVPRAALSYCADGTPGRPGSRAVDAHVSSLRRKVRAAVPAAGRFILCVRGQGYLVP
jgi:hypothetical protein